MGPRRAFSQRLEPKWGSGLSLAHSNRSGGGWLDTQPTGSSAIPDIPESDEEYDIERPDGSSISGGSPPGSSPKGGSPRGGSPKGALKREGSGDGGGSCGGEALVVRFDGSVRDGSTQGRSGGGQPVPGVVGVRWPAAGVGSGGGRGGSGDGGARGGGVHGHAGGVHGHAGGVHRGGGAAVMRWPTAMGGSGRGRGGNSVGGSGRFSDGAGNGGGKGSGEGASGGGGSGCGDTGAGRLSRGNSGVCLHSRVAGGGQTSSTVPATSGGVMVAATGVAARAQPGNGSFSGVGEPGSDGVVVTAVVLPGSGTVTPGAAEAQGGSAGPCLGGR